MKIEYQKPWFLKPKLTEEQKFVLNRLASEVSGVIDEGLCCRTILPDELLDNDDFDEIDRRKSAAYDYLISLLK